MNAKPLAYPSAAAVSTRNAPAETAFGVLGTMPLAIVAIEAVIGFILVLVSACFFATIFFAFVGFILLYVALWIAVVFNVFGAAVSLLTLLAGRRYITGKVFGITGLLIHAVLLGAGVYALANIHSYLGDVQKAPLRQPATYNEGRPVEAWQPIRLEDQPTEQDAESLIGEESRDIEEGVGANDGR